MISNTLTAAQTHDVFTHLLVLICILTLIITVMGVKMVRMWVRKDLLNETKLDYAHAKQCLEDVARKRKRDETDHMNNMRAAERNIDGLKLTIHNLRAQLNKAKSEGETLKQVSFDSRYGKSHRYTTSGNVERISLKETANTVTVVQHLKEGRGVLHVEHNREDIKGPILKVYAEAE
ncbi:MAG: hypothetical protein ACRCYZ_05480 [Alphaproteobacteria bacterium]